MKKLVFGGLAVATSVMVACSDDSSSSDEPQVSCLMSVVMEDELIPYLCMQAPESAKDSVAEECADMTEGGLTLKASWQETGCDAQNAKKTCESDEGSSIFVYDKTVAKQSCEELLADDEEENDDFDNEEDIVVDSTKVMSFYNKKMEVCVEYKLAATLKSSVMQFASDDKDIEFIDGCASVEKEPVQTCDDDNGFDTIVVNYYSDEDKGKTCEELAPFQKVETK